MDDDNDRTVVRSNHLHRPQVPNHRADQSQGGNTLPIGTRLGEFEIIDLIGEGGFGIVYLAYDHSLDRQVALKEYMPSGMASRTRAMQVTVRSRHYVDPFTMGLKSFMNEARMLARFDSPSLVKVYRFWEENGTAYMVMPFYEGVTLKQALKERQVVPDEEWLRAMLANLLDAIDTIHQVQCYHRDIAPDNILILRDGRPLLLDFGAARRVIGDLTQGLTVILKPGFAPIEQYADIPGLRQGPWTDIYALGAVVYFAMLGKAPPPSVARIVNDEMVSAREAGKGRYSDHFLTVLDKMLAVKPEHRIQSAAELRNALGLDEEIPRTMPGSVRGTTPAGTGANGSRGPNSEAPPRRTGSRMPPRDEDDDWRQTMVADQRPLPPEKKSSKTGVVLAMLMLCAGIGAAVVGYRWMNPAETVDTPLAESSDASDASDVSGDSGDSGGAGSAASGNGTAAPASPSTTDTYQSPPPAAALPASAPAAPSPPASPSPPVALNKITPVPTERPAANNALKQPPVPPAAPALLAEDELWRAATAKDTPSAYQSYLKRYPRGKHSAAAKVMLESKHPKLAATIPAPAPAPAQPTSTSKDVPSRAQPSVEAAPNADSRNADKSADAKSTTARAPAEPPSTSELKPPPAEPERTAAAPATPSNSPSPPPAAGTVPSNASGPSSPPPRTGDPDPGTPPIALKTPAPERPNIEPPTKEPAKPEAPTTTAPPPTPDASQRTIALAGQTMTGNFTADPKTGIVSGSGRIHWDNGDRFEGRLVRGSKEGKGQFTWASGQRYSGDWSGDMPNGRGVFHFVNGSRYEGDIRNGEPHGQGTVRFRSGDVYTGSWVKGKHHGPGKYIWTDGTYWEGEFKDGAKTENGRTGVANSRTEGVSTAAAGSSIPAPAADGANQQVTGTAGK